MGESIFSSFEVKLFGREMEDIALKFPTSSKATGKPGGGRRPAFNEATDFDDSRLGQQVKGATGNNPTAANLPRLARIYAFSYEGHFYSVPKPTIYLVHGAGLPLPQQQLATAFKNIQGINSTSIDESGVASRDWYFEDDVRMWTYEKSQMSIRFDLTSGSLEDILLEASLATMSRMAAREGELAAREGELASREGELASREGEMAARSGEMAFRARHRFK